MTASTTVVAMSSIASLGVFLNGIELVTANRTVSRLFAWDVVKTRYAPGSLVARVVSLARPNVNTVVSVQVAAALLVPVCFAFDQTVLAAALAALVFVGLIFTNLRLPYSINAADQMQVVVWAGLLAYALVDTAWGQSIALGFVAAQSVLAYLTAGLWKLLGRSSSWRCGTAVGRVLQTEAYGLPQAQWLSRSVAFSALASWATIGFEVLGPIAVLIGPSYTLVFIGTAVAFHVGIAVAMGLNRFVFAFGASLPAVYWASVQLHGWLETL